MEVKNSWTFSNKLVVFVYTEAENSQELRDLVNGELKKYNGGFTEVVVLGKNKSSLVFPLY